jgi:hypothetical protein
MKKSDKMSSPPVPEQTDDQPIEEVVTSQNFSMRFSKLHSFLTLVEREHGAFYGDVCRELRDLFPEGRPNG